MTRVDLLARSLFAAVPHHQTQGHRQRAVYWPELPGE